MYKRFIKVPQGFYAKITEDSDKDIAGLVTTGLGPCSCLIVTDSKRKYFFLAHVDSCTNIADPTSGLPSWIKEIEEYLEKNNRSKTEINIHIGKGFQEGTFKIDYQKLIEDILEANNISMPKENILMHEVINETSGFIIREGYESEKLNEAITILHNKAQYTNNPIKYNANGRDIDLQDELESNFGQEYTIGIDKISQWRNEELNTETKLSDNDKKYLEKNDWGHYIRFKADITEKLGLPFDGSKNEESKKEDTSLPFPPLCCYDGKKNPFTEKSTQFLNDNIKKINQYKKTLEKCRILEKLRVREFLKKSPYNLTYTAIRKMFNRLYNNFKNTIKHTGLEITK